MSITPQLINLGTNADDHTGDDPRTAGAKINETLKALADAVNNGGGGTTAAVVSVDGTTIQQNGAGVISVVSVEADKVAPGLALADATVILTGTGTSRLDAVKAYLSAGDIDLKTSTVLSAVPPGLQLFVRLADGSPAWLPYTLVSASSGNTTGGTTTPTAYPAATLSGPVYGPGRYNIGMTYGSASGTVAATAIIVLQAVVNFGDSNNHPYGAAMGFTVNGHDVGLYVGDSLDVAGPNAQGNDGRSHTYLSPWDNTPRLVQVVLYKNASGNSHYKILIDGQVSHEDDMPAFALGTTISWLVDKYRLGANGYVDDIQLLTSDVGLPTSVPTTAAVHGSYTTVIYNFDKQDGTGT